jgi:hypothetical protein
VNGPDGRPERRLDSHAAASTIRSSFRSISSASSTEPLRVQVGKRRRAQFLLDIAVDLREVLKRLVGYILTDRSPR